MAGVDFIHLHVHSDYSLLESSNTIAGLVKAAAADRQPALALTDTNNMFAALEFSEKAAGAGIQPINGIQLSISFGAYNPNLKDPRPAEFPIVLLAQNEAGYLNLMALSSRAFTDVPLGDKPLLHIDALEGQTDGLICLTGGPKGPVDERLFRGDRAEAELRLNRLHDLFGSDHLYVELQRHGLPREGEVEKLLVEMAGARDLRIVATNEPLFFKPEDHAAHDALLALSDGAVLSQEVRPRVRASHSFKTRAEMVALFSDLPDALQATVEIAQRCAYRSLTRKPILPRFADGDEAAELRRQAEAGLEARLLKHGPADGFAIEDYVDRLAFELGVIERMGFPGYFLIVSDFIKWAKANDIPVGPGRGSGAGSVVAWALTITDLDPLRFGLLFERFLNPDRVSMPDFDVDFCIDGRERVIDYVREKYGRENVAQIITFGTLLARGVLRDTGRVLELSMGLINRLCGMVPNNPAKPVKLAEAIEGEPRLQEAMEVETGVDRLFEVAKKLEGLHRHASTHAAGVVIGDRPLHELVPLYRDPQTGQPVTQLNMKWVEPAGLVKFDFLGLKTLTVIRRAVDLIAAKGIALDIAAIPLDDEATFAMLQRADVTGVFQVESAGMRKALSEMVADRIEDLIALVALYRPGPMANIPLYCDRKLGRDVDTATWYPHPALEPVLRETFGIIVYQEQVMEVAKLLAGYTLGEADLLRRAMGKKIKEEMDKQGARFVSGCVERGIPEDTAQEIFDLLAKFADYGFNKSHAAAYALISYQTAYLKANFPVEFLAACMTMEAGDTAKLYDFRREAKSAGIPIDPPSVNRSGATFEVHGDTVSYGLTAIKGVGIAATEALVAERRARGPFTSLADIAGRIDPTIVTKRVLEKMAAAGALDELEPDRARAVATAPGIVDYARDRSKRSATLDLFSAELAPVTLVVDEVPDWSERDRLQAEYDALGSFLSGHPLDEYGEVLSKLGMMSWVEICRAAATVETEGRLAATVIRKEEKRTKSGNKIGIVTLSDPSGQYEAILFSKDLDEHRAVLTPGEQLVIGLTVSIEGTDTRARISSVQRLDEAMSRQVRALRVTLDDGADIPAIAALLGEPGPAAVTFYVGGMVIPTMRRFAVGPVTVLRLESMPGVRGVTVT